MHRAAAALSAVAAAALVAAAAAPADARVLVRLQDPRIAEASGLAPGLRSPGVLWVQNDSGDSARVFAVDARTGATAAVLAVRGATNVDWEDLAVARDSRGVPSLWIADTGDNDGLRREVELYRVDEPRVPAGSRDLALRSVPADVVRLRYPDGPQDAEALAVLPGGTAYVVTKSLLGVAGVYRVPAEGAGVRTLVRVGTLTLTGTGTPGGPNVVGQVTVTGAAVSADGAVLAVRTYTDAYLWRLRDGDVAAAVRARPVRVALPPRPQGEGIAVVDDGVTRMTPSSTGGRRTLLLDTEGVRTPVDAVAVPTLPVPSPAATASSSSPSRPRPSPPATPAPTASRRGSSATLLGVLAGVAALGALAAVGLGVRRRRRRRAG